MRSRTSTLGRRRALADLQGLGALDLDGFERAPVVAEQTEDGRGDLCRFDGGVDAPAAFDLSARNHQRNVTVFRVVAAVLGDRAFAAGKDGAVLGDTDDVRKSVQVEGTQALQIG